MTLPSRWMLYGQIIPIKDKTRPEIMRGLTDVVESTPLDKIVKIYRGQPIEISLERESRGDEPKADESRSRALPLLKEREGGEKVVKGERECIQLF